jgi:hypothetical protein
MNLGDGARVFHNRLNKPVFVPVGAVVIADLSNHVVQGLQFAQNPTVLVGDPSVTEIPEEMRKIVDILTTVDFESTNVLIQKFNAIAPPNNMVNMHPSRMQIRIFLRTMVEDWIATQTGHEKQIRDDVDPDRLLREFNRQRFPQDPPHPLTQRPAVDPSKTDDSVHPFKQVAPVERMPERPPARVRVPENKKPRRNRR